MRTGCLIMLVSASLVTGLLIALAATDIRLAAIGALLLLLGVIITIDRPEKENS